jgi:DNA-binding NtrC family response regulator/tetratricopeptide (TPR) repeat protein
MIGSVLFVLGYIAFQKSYFDLSESYYKKALEQFNAIKKSNELRKTYHMLGILAYRTGRFGEAKTNLTMAKKWAVKSDNSIGIINSNIALARLSMYFGDSKHAKNLLARSYSESNELGYGRGIALSAEFLGELSYHQGKYADCLAYLEEARRLAIAIAPRGDIAVEVYRRLGDVYIALKRLEEAERVLAEALDIAEDLNDRYEQGSIFRALGVLASCREDIDLARSFFTESIARLKLIKESYELARTYMTAATAYGRWLESEEIEIAAGKELARDARDFASEAVHLYGALGLDRRTRESKGLVRRIELISCPDVPVAKVERLSFRRKWLVGESVVARSHRMLEAVAKADRLARSTIPVLITGETGTGKEVIARVMHRLSGRARGPFVAVNCAALADTVFESELFGHRRGAFTGAERDHAGLIEKASRGTLFLDEISELSGAQQAKLLRVLQDGTVRRVGEVVDREVDVRVVTATNEDVDGLLRSGRLREDFYHRIAGDRIELVPLRERREDIVALFAYYMEMERGSVKVEEGVVELLVHYHWPGNVRELLNMVRVLSVFAEAKGLVRVIDLPLRIRDFSAYKQGEMRRLAHGARGGSCAMGYDHERDPEGIRRLVASTLRKNKGNRSAAARELGISRRTLYRRLEELGLLEK